MNNQQPTPQEMERAKSDPLYIALILRQRLRNARAIAEDAPRDPTLWISVSDYEADILLNHFVSFAEKAHELSRLLTFSQKEAEKVAERLAAVREQGEKWHRDAKHANDLIGRVMHLFARDQWRVEKMEDQGWIIHTPRVDGMAAHTIAFEDSPNPAEALLALILEAAIETGKAGYEWPTLADALDELGRKGGDVEL